MPSVTAQPFVPGLVLAPRGGTWGSGGVLERWRNRGRVEGNWTDGEMGEEWRGSGGMEK